MIKVTLPKLITYNQMF